MKTYYVYILRCSDNSLYTGITNNIERRFSEHQEGKLKKEALISGDFNMLQILAECRNATHSKYKP